MQTILLQTVSIASPVEPQAVNPRTLPGSTIMPLAGGNHHPPPSPTPTHQPPHLLRTQWAGVCLCLLELQPSLHPIDAEVEVRATRSHSPGLDPLEVDQTSDVVTEETPEPTVDAHRSKNPDHDVTDRAVRTPHDRTDR